MSRIAALMDRVLRAPDDASEKAAVREEVRELTRSFPLYTRRA
jgi:glycine/serine hydroxymethyltransferase